MSTMTGTAKMAGTGSPKMSPAKLMKPMTMKGSFPPAPKSSMTSLQVHGDGTYSTMSGDYGGERMQHPSIGHALAHMAMMHSTGTHVLIHQNSPIKMHVVKDGKKSEHSPKNLEALKSSLGKFLDEEEQEKD